MGQKSVPRTVPMELTLNKARFNYFLDFIGSRPLSATHHVFWILGCPLLSNKMLKVWWFCMLRNKTAKTHRLAKLFFQFTLFLLFLSNLQITVSNQHVSNVWFQSEYNLALDSLFLIYEFCFQSKFIVSNVFCFQSHNLVYYQSTYYQSKYFWNVEMGFEQFRYACPSVSKVKGH